MPQPLSPRDCEVYVLGAGITGLTAAHELIRRGFRVTVIEQHHGSPLDEGRAPCGLLRGITDVSVGGIARTQWATAPDSPASHPGRSFATVAGLGSCEPFREVGRGGRAVLECIPPAFGQPWLSIPCDQSNTAFVNQDTEDALLCLAKSSEAEAVQLIGYNYRLADGLPAPIGTVPLGIFGPAAAYQRLGDAATKLHALGYPPTDLRIFPVACVEVIVDGPRYRALEEAFASPEARIPGAAVRFHYGQLVPGEHGYRFFAGFYRHLRRTMEDTRLTTHEHSATGRSRVVFSERSARDNLKEVRWQVIADPTRPRPVAFRRKPSPTLADAIGQYELMRRDLGLRGSDLLRFFLRLARYASSCTRRRKECYERLSWQDFVTLRDLDPVPDSMPGAPNAPLLPYGRRAKHMINHSPEALVAMRSETTDARTQGNLSVQLALDQLGRHEQTDSTLTDTTSVAWLDRWKEFLTLQGVKFRVGRVGEITARGVVLAWPTPEMLPYGNRVLPQTYVVCALDAVSAARVLKPLRQKLEEDADAEESHRHAPFRLIKLLQDENPEDIREPRDPRDRFQVLTGIQFYYDNDVSFADGHIYFALSPWGLSAISQVQYWRPIGKRAKADPGRLRLKGNLSVDIGSWRPAVIPDWAARGPNSPEHTRYRNPSRHNRNELACKIDEQIRWGMGALNKSRFTQPYDGYHVDNHILFERRGKVENGHLRARWNLAPFLTNVVGMWDDRPAGEPWSPNHCDDAFRAPGDGSYFAKREPDPRTNLHAIWRRNDGLGYPVYYDGLVFAGPHMRTFTRMNTMETANESARHAVNAILDHLTFLQQPDATTMARGLKPMGKPLENVFDDAPARKTEPLAAITPNGDYCDIYDPEEHEFAELEFLKEIDEHLYAMSERGTTEDAPADSNDEVRPKRPHLFDILDLDRLPDLMDQGESAVDVWRAVASALESIDRSSVDDVVRWTDASRAWVRSAALDDLLSGLANPKTSGIEALRALERLVKGGKRRP